MRILILGGTGMLGHKLALGLAPAHTVLITTRTGQSPLRLETTAFDDSDNATIMETLLDQTRPDVVINAIGIIKQIVSATLEQVAINAMLPQRMAALCAVRHIRFITFGTDCVFDGISGAPYGESDPPTAHDVYGMTKYLGEVYENPWAFTIRSSIIGPELRGHKSLLEWILHSRGQTVHGYTKALYTGLPTVEMARLVGFVIDQQPTLSGVWQVASDAIDKASLIRLVSDKFGLGITVENDTGYICDRRLDGSRFRLATGYVVPPWPDLVAAMYDDYRDNGGLYAAT